MSDKEEMRRLLRNMSAEELRTLVRHISSSSRSLDIISEIISVLRGGEENE